jgi:hypothetical protein
MLRRAFVGEISRRFRIIKDKITDAIVTQDVFGLSAPPIGIRVAVSSGLNRAAYAFKTNPEKARSFMEWLHGEVNKDLLIHFLDEMRCTDRQGSFIISTLFPADYIIINGSRSLIVC